MSRHAARVVRNDEFWASACSCMTARRRRRQRPVMGASAPTLLHSVILAFAFAGTAYAEHADKAAVSPRELQGKIAYCEDCHGVSTRISRLLSNPAARGTATRIHQEPIGGVLEHRRTNNIMFDVAHVLSPATLDALTESFHYLNPKPVTTPAPEDLVAAGKKIYEEGIANSDARRAPDAMGLMPKATLSFRG